MDIQIVSVKPEAGVTKTGNPYEKLQVVYRNTEGRVAQKVILPFGESAPIFGVLKNAKDGDTFSVVTAKNGQYVDWKEIARQDSMMVNAAAKPYTPAVKDTRESPEERNLRQHLIVRQSCLSNAIAAMVPGATAELSTAAIVEKAQDLYNWVFEITPPDDMADDIPF